MHHASHFWSYCDETNILEHALTRWNRTKLKIWPFCWHIWHAQRKGRMSKVTMTTRDICALMRARTFGMGNLLIICKTKSNLKWAICNPDDLIWQSWKFDLSVDFWPCRKGRTSRSPWTLLILGLRRTIWYLNPLKSGKVENLTFLLTFDPEVKGSEVGVNVITFVASHP